MRGDQPVVSAASLIVRASIRVTNPNTVVSRLAPVRQAATARIRQFCRCAVPEAHVASVLPHPQEVDMDSRSSQQLATIRTAEAIERATPARMARDGRPERTRTPPRV